MTRRMFIPIHQQPVAWAMRTNVDVPQFADEYVRLWFATIKRRNHRRSAALAAATS